MALRIDRLKALREQHGWSQREFARLCGLADSQVNRYESGDNDPSATNLRAMAKMLGVSTDYLLGLSDEPRGHAYDALTPDQQRLLKAIDDGDSFSVLQIAATLLQRRTDQGQRRE